MTLQYNSLGGKQWKVVFHFCSFVVLSWYICQGSSSHSWNQSFTRFLEKGEWVHNLKYSCTRKCSLFTILTSGISKVSNFPILPKMLSKKIPFEDYREVQLTILGNSKPKPGPLYRQIRVLGYPNYLCYSH